MYAALRGAVEALYAKHALGSGLLSHDVTDDDVHVITESQRQQAHLASSLAGLRDAAASVEAARKAHRAALVRVNMGLIDQIKRLRERVAAAKLVVRNWPLEHGGGGRGAATTAAAAAAAAATRRRRSSTGALPSATSTARTGPGGRDTDGGGSAADDVGDGDDAGGAASAAAREALRAVRLAHPSAEPVTAAAGAATSMAATQRGAVPAPQLVKGTTSSTAAVARRRASTGDVPSTSAHAVGGSSLLTPSAASRTPVAVWDGGFVDVKPLQTTTARAVADVTVGDGPKAAAVGAAALPSSTRGRLAKGTTVQKARGSGPPPLVEQG